MKKKIVSVLLCAAMVATMAVGCGGKKTDGDSGSSKGGDKLVYWAMWSEDEPQAKVIKDAIAKYTEDTGCLLYTSRRGANCRTPRRALLPAGRYPGR